MSKPQDLPAQEQEKQPGKEHKMHPLPEVIRKSYKGSGKLKNKKALITGGDSGIGRAVAIHFAREGADVAIIYKDEDNDAKDTKTMVEEEDQKCMIIRNDLRDKAQCEKAIDEIIDEWSSIDILVNNAAVQFPKDDLTEISEEQLKNTYNTNIFPMFYITQKALKNMKEGGCIINSTSVTAFRGSPHLLDYSSTKGAILSFSRSLSGNLVEKGIRVNSVAPGPIWTPLIPSSFGEEKVDKFGQNTPMGRPGQPSEVAPAYVFLASEDSSYITGQVIHVNGGDYLGN